MEEEEILSLQEELEQRGINVTTKPQGSIPEDSELGRLRHNIVHALGHFFTPRPWYGYSVDLNKADRHDLEPETLRLGAAPYSFPDNPDEPGEEFNDIIGPVWCAPGPDYPNTITKPNVPKGSAIWVHTPWGTFPTYTFDQAARLVWGAMLLANTDIARYIASEEEPPIWPYHATMAVPTFLPEGREAQKALDRHLAWEDSK